MRLWLAKSGLELHQPCLGWQRRGAGGERRGGEGRAFSQHPGLCFSSFNCSVNHLNKLFTNHPAALRLGGFRSQKVLGDEFPELGKRGRRTVLMGALVGLAAEEADGGLAEKAGESGKASLQLFAGPRPSAQKPLSQSSNLPRPATQVPSPHLSPLSLSLLMLLTG